MSYLILPLTSMTIQFSAALPQSFSTILGTFKLSSSFICQNLIEITGFCHNISLLSEPVAKEGF